MAPNLLFTGLLNAGVDGNVVYYQPTAAGSFTVNAVASDPESGVTRYSFPTIPGFAQVGTGASRTYNYTSPVSPPVGPLIVTATNPEGCRLPGRLVHGRTRPHAAEAGRPLQRRTVPGEELPGPGDGDVHRGRHAWLRGRPDPIHDERDRSDEGRRVRVRLAVRGPVPDPSDRARLRQGRQREQPALAHGALARRIGWSLALRPGSASGRLLATSEARLSSTRRAHVLAVMTGPGLKAPGRWRFILEGGAWIVQLRLPETIQRGGAYTVRWAVSAGTRSTSKVTQVTLR